MNINSNYILQKLFNNDSLYITQQKYDDYNFGIYVKTINNKYFWIIEENNLYDKLVVLVEDNLNDNNKNFIEKLNDLWILNSMIYDKFCSNFKNDIENFVLENPLNYGKYLWNQRPLLDKDIYSYDQIQTMIKNYIDYCYKYPLEFLKNHYDIDNNIEMFLFFKDILKLKQLAEDFVNNYDYVETLRIYWKFDNNNHYDYYDNLTNQKYLILEY